MAASLAFAAVPAQRAFAADPGWGLPELMASLHAVHAGQARFIERKFLQMVTEPLQSSGILRYTAPNRLEKQTLLPKPSRLAIDGDRVTVDRDGESRYTLSLEATPELGALVAGVRATMAGDAATLERFYRPTLSGNAAAWQLDLVPRNLRMHELVSRIRITGHFATLSGVVTEEADGDRTETVILPDPS